MKTKVKIGLGPFSATFDIELFEADDSNAAAAVESVQQNAQEAVNAANRADQAASRAEAVAANAEAAAGIGTQKAKP